ncbi:formate dehydrogenase accessory sulfurtransferase FdhD [Paenibacillus chondroitinus]|uniref:Sulfur carrier protein FdhD n=1 Tax=Paenibacillus chondroitinus TaxID=59842 RepID=A0ABU6DLR2_9BACL|nr:MULTISPECIES: formate dehydrogenase accessory sulfurtransferase FdhD [Paenibacillus]MCY9661455.1 formate dehydrogenase accessory sulfurtransferase FdhD [Paenibacillus anseongense]MEB4798683.1 formate dehydrogenase accessory sulfurtransferase FdhD [Paenibacillus chondroitinus]
MENEQDQVEPGRSSTTTWNIYRYNGTEILPQEDTIATETPLTIKVDGEEFATLVHTPTDTVDLVTGFLASEGLIRFVDQIESLTLEEERGFAHVKLRHLHQLSKQMVSKRFIGSCCGKSRQFYFHNDARTAKTVSTKLQITIQQCFHLMNLMQEQSADFRATGGLHNAALCTANELLLSRSDIGRHNALDKIYGHALRQRISVRDKVIAFSGRVSSEVVLKVAKIGVGILLSKSAPTDLALRLAQDLGITVVGFIRRDQLTVYTHPQRITECR